MSTRRSFVLVAVALALIGMTLTACTNNPQPTPTQSTSGPTTSSATPTPSPSTPASTPTSSNTATAPSNPPPGQVQGLKAETGGGSGEVLLTWTQSSELDVVSYIVYRSLTSGGSFTRIGTMTRQDVTQFPVRPFVDSQANVAYYRVRAVDSAGQRGPLSAEVCGASPGNHC
ncbi:hypothetical protein ACFPJ4_13980 [Lysinimonas soli]|uniref:Fibronectin type III domain-containing protein n=1 Tax=Lysinimonas soli TaxID=1074233 RepID=A0ABW0NTD8_9MICO